MIYVAKLKDHNRLGAPRQKNDNLDQDVSQLYLECDSEYPIEYEYCSDMSLHEINSCL